MKHTMKVYKDTALHAEYMRVRFPTGQSHPKSFELEGHRWAYECTAFDDVGDYDRLYRFTDDDIEIPDNTDLRDTFAAAALMGFAGNPAWDGTGSDIMARAAYKAADDMLAARSRIS